MPDVLWNRKGEIEALKTKQDMHAGCSRSFYQPLSLW